MINKPMGRKTNIFVRLYRYFGWNWEMECINYARRDKCGAHSPEYSSGAPTALLFASRLRDETYLYYEIKSDFVLGILVFGIVFGVVVASICDIAQDGAR